MIRLRITPDGTVRGLWTDVVDLPAIGECNVRRASHVEFDQERQCWTVRTVETCGRLRRWLRRVSRRSKPATLFQTPDREIALAWEQTYFEPGGPGWPTLKH